MPAHFSFSRHILSKPHGHGGPNQLVCTSNPIVVSTADWIRKGNKNKTELIRCSPRIRNNRPRTRSQTVLGTGFIRPLRDGTRIRSRACQSPCTGSCYGGASVLKQSWSTDGLKTATIQAKAKNMRERDWERGTETEKAFNPPTSQEDSLKTGF